MVLAGDVACLSEQGGLGPEGGRAEEDTRD